MELTVNLGPDTYPIYIENGILPQTGSYIRKFFTGKKIMIISDDHVFPLYGKTVLDSRQFFRSLPLGLLILHAAHPVVIGTFLRTCALSVSSNKGSSFFSRP